MMQKQRYFFISVFSLLAGTLLLLSSGCGSSSPTPALQGKKMTVYYSPSCTCCGRYIDYLEQNGLRVEALSTGDRTFLMQEYGFPARARSCHTGILDNYVVEGHVPVQALKKLVMEQPDLTGIALPGMPPHSPGMGGPTGRFLKIFRVNREGRVDGVFTESKW